MTNSRRQAVALPALALRNDGTVFDTSQSTPVSGGTDPFRADTGGDGSRDGEDCLLEYGNSELIINDFGFIVPNPFYSNVT